MRPSTAGRALAALDAAFEDIEVPSRRAAPGPAGRLAPEDLVGGRYRVTAFLEGRPGLTRYRARHLDDDQEVTITSLTGAPRTAEWSSSFREVIGRQMNLRHPNIVAVLDYGFFEDGTPYYVEESVDGPTLFRRLQEGPLPEVELAPLIRDCVNAVVYAHRAGLLHLGLVPASVYLPKTPVAVTAKISNFVLASLDSLADAPDGFTDIRVAAPEVLRGASPTPAADVYGLGHLFAAAVMGRLFLHAHRDGDLHLVHHPFRVPRDNVVDPQLLDIVDRCLEKELSRRYAGADDVLQAFRAWEGRPRHRSPSGWGQPTAKAGHMLNGRYELQRVVGRGAFAQVFLAIDVERGERVAVKVLHAHLADTDERQRFEREGEVGFTRLNNDHTVEVFDYGVSSDGLCFITTEYIEGTTLDLVLDRHGPQSADRVAAILHQVLESLDDAHGRQVFHRDLKPSNIMLSPRDYRLPGLYFPNCWATVLDFGVATIQDDLQEFPSLTLTGTAVGTPRYMAPEQLFGDPIGPETDLYSLGLVAFELLTNEKAIKGESTGEIITNQVSPQSAILEPRAQIPAGLLAIVNKMIRKERKLRYATARDVLHALQQFLF